MDSFPKTIKYEIRCTASNFKQYLIDMCQLELIFMDATSKTEVAKATIKF